MNFLRPALAVAPVLGALLLVSSFVACSSDDSSPAGADASTPVAEGGSSADSAVPETGPGVDSSTPPDAAADAGGCNNVTNGAVVVGEVAGIGVAPAGAGGTIVDGTYYLTKHEVYPPDSPDANSRRRTLVISGNTVMQADNDTGKPEVRAAGTFTAAGSTLSVTFTCPAAASVSIPYTATPTTFTIHDKNDIFTYTKQ